MRPMSEEIELERGVGSDATDGLIVDRPWSAASARGMSQPAKAEPVPIHRGMTVAEGFDYMIGGDTNMGGAVLDHFQDHAELAGDGPERRIGFSKTPDAVEVTKEFVGAVDEVNDHVIFHSSFRIYHSQSIHDVRTHLVSNDE